MRNTGQVDTSRVCAQVRRERGSSAKKNGEDAQFWRWRSGCEHGDSAAALKERTDRLGVSEVAPVRTAQWMARSRSASARHTRPEGDVGDSTVGANEPRRTSLSHRAGGAGAGCGRLQSSWEGAAQDQQPADGSTPRPKGSVQRAPLAGRPPCKPMAILPGQCGRGLLLAVSLGAHSPGPAHPFGQYRGRGDCAGHGCPAVRLRAVPGALGRANVGRSVQFGIPPWCPATRGGCGLHRSRSRMGGTDLKRMLTHGCPHRSAALPVQCR